VEEVKKSNLRSCEMKTKKKLGEKTSESDPSWKPKDCYFLAEVGTGEMVDDGGRGGNKGFIVTE